MEQNTERISDSTDRWKYVIVLSKFVIHLLEASISKSFGVLIPGMVVLFDTHLSVLGLLCSFPVTWMLVACPVVAYLLKYDRVSPRVVAILGALISSGTIIASGYTRNVRILGVYLAFNGLGMGMNFMPTLVLLNDFFPRRFVLMSTVTLFGSIIGILFVPLLTEQWVRRYGYTGAMLILGGLMLHTLAGGVAIRQPRDESELKKVNNENASPERDMQDSPCSDPSIDNQKVECKHLDDDKEFRQMPTNNGRGNRASPSKYPTSCEKYSSDDVGTTVGMVGAASKNEGVVYTKTTQEEQECLEIGNMPENDGNVKEPHESNVLINNDCISSVASEERVHRGLHKNPAINWLRDGIFIKDYLFTLTLPTHLFIQYGAYAWMLFLVPHAEWLGFSSEKAVLLSTIGGVGALVGRIALFVILYFDVDEFRICCVASSIAAVTFLVDSMVRSFYALCAVAFIQGWAIFTNTAIPPAFCKTTTSPSNFGIGSGYSALVGGLGANIGGLMSGVIFDVTQSYTMVFISIGGVHCLILFNVIIYLIVQRRRKHLINQDQQKYSSPV